MLHDPLLWALLIVVPAASCVPLRLEMRRRIAPGFGGRAWAEMVLLLTAGVVAGYVACVWIVDLKMGPTTSLGLETAAEVAGVVAIFLWASSFVVIPAAVVRYQYRTGWRPALIASARAAANILVVFGALAVGWWAVREL